MPGKATPVSVELLRPAFCVSFLRWGSSVFAPATELPGGAEITLPRLVAGQMRDWGDGIVILGEGDPATVFCVKRICLAEVGCLGTTAFSPFVEIPAGATIATKEAAAGSLVAMELARPVPEGAASREEDKQMRRSPCRNRLP